MMSLIQQLQDPDPLQRQQAIIKLARTGDEQAIPALSAIAEHDAVPKLRKLARQATRHIQRSKSTLLQTPPGVNQEAEARYLKAIQLHKQGDIGDALLYLAKALELSPRMAAEQDVQQLGFRLTGLEGTVACEVIADPEQRNDLIRQMNANRSKRSIRSLPREAIIVILFILTVGGFLLSVGRGRIQNFFAVQQLEELKSNLRRVDGIPYYVVAPEGGAPVDGWRTLVVLGRGEVAVDAILNLFAPHTMANDVLLVIPAFPAYPTPFGEGVLPTLDRMLGAVQAEFSIHDPGMVLFGFEIGGEIASLYASEYPGIAAGVVMSGATYIYPPTDDEQQPEYLIIYGEFDELLVGISDTEALFTNISLWDERLDYLVIEGISREVNEQQVALTLELMDEIFGQTSSDEIKKN